MKQAELPEITQRIEALAKASSLGSRIQNIDVEPGEFDDGQPYLKVWLTFDQTDDLKWPMLKPLILDIEVSLEGIDDRFPSVRLADAS